MDLTLLQAWISANPVLAASAAVLSIIVIYLITRLVFARGLIHLAGRTKNKYDDILMKRLRPYRAAWLAPFILLYIFAYLAESRQDLVQKIALFFILWLSVVSLNGLLDALNEIYESSRSFNGVSIQGYLDIVKLLAVMVAIILSISLVTDETPILLLSGLGALTAVLLLIFQDTILSLVASIQIASHDLVKEGDWIEVPSYDADGDVINISLHTIKVQNFDKTITVIPTHKMISVAYKNWRGMQESGGRRIMRALHIDKNSIKFCDTEMLARLGKIDLIAEDIARRQERLASYHLDAQTVDSPLDGPQITNVEIYRTYIEAYLRAHKDIHSKKMDFLVRELAPGPTGLPIELYVFTRTTKWNEYERIQAEIFDHLLAALGFFDLRVFQEPSGADFARALQTA
jgi:miniconductance mechanosensitive channel